MTSKDMRSQTAVINILPDLIANLDTFVYSHEFPSDSYSSSLKNMLYKVINPLIASVGKYCNKKLPITHEGHESAFGLQLATSSVTIGKIQDIH